MLAFLASLYFLSVVPLPAQAQAPGGSEISSNVSLPLFSIRVLPDAILPLGAESSLFGFGGGATLAATYRLPPVPLLFLGGELGYTYVSTNAPGTSVSTMVVGAEAGVHFQMTPSLWARLYGDGGYFLAMLNEAGSKVDYNPYVGGGLTVGLDILRNLSVTLGAGYRYYAALFGGVTAGLGVSYQFPVGSGGTNQLPRGFEPIRNDGRGLKLYGVKLDSVFPVFYKYYDDHPIGSAILRNYESVPAEDLKVSVNVKQYMDNPKECKVPVSVGAGRNGDVVLYGLFTDKILEVAESTKISLSLTVEYRQYGRTFRDEYIQTLPVLDRNALTWSDDRKAAAFVSAKDPQVQIFAKGVSVSVKNSVRPGVNDNLQAAMAIHQALLLNGITYVADPVSALTTNNREIVDFILYPQQTLGYKAGKCGDLTVLYCSLLESIGIATAFITVPGHILMAFDLDMTEENARQVFANPDDLIFSDGKTWLPIETTLRTGDFLDAWAEGIHQWRMGVEKKDVAFYTIRDSWKLYNPVVFSGNSSSPSMPESRKIADSFNKTFLSFVDQQLGSRVADLQRKLKQTPGNVQLINRLGLLYAKFGVYDKATEQFAAILKKQEAASTLLNIGNVYFLRGRYADALGFYSRALKKAPSDAKILLAVARGNEALEKYPEAQESFNKLKVVDPALASRYAFLDTGGGTATRASSAEKPKGDVLWQE